MAEALVPELPDFLLSTTPSEILEFAKAATGFILKAERTMPSCRKSASETQMAADSVFKAVQILCHIYIRGVEDNFSTMKMEELLLRLGFEKTASQCLVEHFAIKRTEIKNLFGNPRLYVPSYRKLEWRLDIQIASRSLLSQRTPSFLLKFSLNPQHLDMRMGSIVLPGLHKNDARRCREIYLEADYCSLKSILTSLEHALAARKRNVAPLDHRL